MSQIARRLWDSRTRFLAPGGRQPLDEFILGMLGLLVAAQQFFTVVTGYDPVATMTGMASVLVVLVIIMATPIVGLSAQVLAVWVYRETKRVVRRARLGMGNRPD